MKKKQSITKLKKYKLTNAIIADYFNYSTEHSFANSSSSKDVKNGIESIIEHVENQLIKHLDS